jgi:hypothetical protein
MKKTFILLALLSLLISCQREKANEVGVGYNKSLIIPPTNDLPHQDLLKRPPKAIKVQILWLTLFLLKQKLIKLTPQ